MSHLGGDIRHLPRTVARAAVIRPEKDRSDDISAPVTSVADLYPRSLAKLDQHPAW
jgi:hypothetical protein